MDFWKNGKGFSTDWANFFALLAQRLGIEPGRLAAWCECTAH
jgi:hypothetical protein